MSLGTSELMSSEQLSAKALPAQPLSEEPQQVGLLGLNRVGRHFVEAMSGGGPFRIVSAWDSDAESCEHARSLNVPLLPSVQELASRPELNVLWVTLPNWLDEAWAASVLDSGKLIVCEWPFSLSHAQAQAAFHRVHERGSQLLVHGSRPDEEDFRQAFASTQNADWGMLRAAKLMSWTYGLPPSGVATKSVRGSSEDSLRAMLLRMTAQKLDQLCRLISRKPTRVFASSTSDLAHDRNAASLAMRIEFGNEATAEVDVRLNSPTQLQTGWVLTAQRGGYSHGRCYSLTDDGEIFDSAAVMRSAVGDSYSAIAQQLLGKPDSPANSRVLTVVQLLDAALRSLKMGQAILV